MKATAWLKSFIYFLLIVGILWLQGFVGSKFQNQYSMTGKVNYVMFTLMILTPLLLGVVLGIETLLHERAKEGKWKFNLSKLVFMILPAIVANSFYYITFFQIEVLYTKLITPVVTFFGNSDLFITLLTVVLGYALITIMYKEKAKEEAVAEGNDIYYEENQMTDNDLDMSGVDETIETTETDGDEEIADYVDAADTEDSDK